jgi:hypothetical protein
MDELVAKVAAATGVAPAIARKAVVIILGFLQREAKSDKVGELFDALPGAREAVGTGGGGASGVMGVFGELSGAGLGMGQIQGAARAFMEFARQKAGPAAVDEVVRSVPGLGQFI